MFHQAHNTHSTFDCSRLVIVSSPGTHSSSVNGPRRIKILSRYFLDAVNEVTMLSKLTYHLARADAVPFVMIDAMRDWKLW